MCAYTRRTRRIDKHVLGHFYFLVCHVLPWLTAGTHVVVVTRWSTTTHQVHSLIPSLSLTLSATFFRYFTINNSFSFLLERVLNFEVIFKNEVLNCGLFEQQKWTQSINTAYWQKNKNDQRFYAMADRLSLAHSHLRSGTIFSLI